MPRLSVSLLGSFEVTLDDEPVTTFESNKVRALLAYLIVEADQLLPFQCDFDSFTSCGRLVANLSTQEERWHAKST